MTDTTALIAAHIEAARAEDEAHLIATIKTERVKAREANNRTADSLEDVLRLAMRLRDRVPRFDISVAHLPDGEYEFDLEPLGVGRDLAAALADLHERAQAIVDVLTAAEATFHRDRGYLAGREADTYGPLED